MGQILIIDDDELVRRSIATILEIKGHTASTTADGDHGIELCRNNDFDIVITDIFMPAKDGLEVIASLRNFDPKIKIIAMSGGGIVDRNSVLESAKRIGAELCLFKPISSTDLVAAVRTLLEAPGDDE